ncbi:MAG TPA: ACT domain-containing protein [Syntrophales bacterium]|nr:ACT domain-containing protein [Syntrophales bacterium]HOX94053.1 ACT domain-containing protein [Syntrophales bacterium]HPI58083.1 ACT domain-containing protein [Syntrophales bacterium]HPN24618.1 ACT domain-containing protein [Syntrophales bacterium]HQM28923.1 ACT domain-containing protein [Syntrophales bacterium]
MAIAKRAKQLTFTLPNRVGLLAEVTSFIATAKINIEAICAYGRGEEGVFMIVTDHNAKARKILTHMGAEVKTEDVIIVEVPNKPGQLHAASKKIAAAVVDIAYVYASPSKGKMSLVFKTDNTPKALKAMRK